MAAKRRTLSLVFAAIALLAAPAVFASIPRSTILDEPASIDFIRQMRVGVGVVDASIENAPPARPETSGALPLVDQLRSAADAVWPLASLAETRIRVFDHLAPFEQQQPSELTRAVRQAYAEFSPGSAADESFCGGDPVNCSDPDGMQARPAPRPPMRPVVYPPRPGQRGPVITAPRAPTPYAPGDWLTLRNAVEAAKASRPKGAGARAFGGRTADELTGQEQEAFIAQRNCQRDPACAAEVAQVQQQLFSPWIEQLVENNPPPPVLALGGAGSGDGTDNGKRVPNPWGQHGKADHRATVERLVRLAQAEYPDASTYEIRQNTSVRELTGINRRPDVWVVNIRTGNVEKIYEAARTTASGQFVPRERAKKVQYDTAGIPSHFEQVKP